MFLHGEKEENEEKKENNREQNVGRFDIMRHACKQGRILSTYLADYIRPFGCMCFPLTNAVVLAAFLQAKYVSRKQNGLIAILCTIQVMWRLHPVSASTIDMSADHYDHALNTKPVSPKAAMVSCHRVSQNGNGSSSLTRF